MVIFIYRKLSEKKRHLSRESYAYRYIFKTSIFYIFIRVS